MENDKLQNEINEAINRINGIDNTSIRSELENIFKLGYESGQEDIFNLFEFDNDDF